MVCVRRFFRIVRIAVTALSLVICVATAGLWVRSFLAADYVRCLRPSGWSPFAISDRGSIQLKIVVYSHPPARVSWGHGSEQGDYRWNIDLDMGRGIERWERGGRRVAFFETS